jgi:hypothetical protein
VWKIEGCVGAQRAGREVIHEDMADAADGYPFLQAAHVALSEARKWIDRYGEVSPVPFEAEIPWWCSSRGPGRILIV